ncbi:MAG: ECF RNA polymerase sigma factor SigK [Acidimicrobiales bacterium]
MGEVSPFKRRAATPPAEADRASTLMAAVSRGDESAFAELYDLFAGLLFGIVVSVVRDPAQSEEVTQEVFLEIWRIAPRFDRSKGTVKSWMAAIAHRRAVDRVRSEQAARNREDREHQLSVEAPDPIAEAVNDELQHERVRQALHTLTETQRSAIELAYFGGRTYREVAVLLDIPEGTAKTRIRDGLIRLRDHLGVTV